MGLADEGARRGPWRMRRGPQSIASALPPVTFATRSCIFAFRPLVLLLFAGLVACFLSLAIASTASAATSDEQASLEIEMPASITMARIDVVALPAETTPASIETGIPCGMLEMCGQDPCLCGAVDQWGSCACNGTQETRPTFLLTCDQEGVVGMVEVFGTRYLVSLGTGSTDAVVRAELPHYEAAEATTHIEVAPFGFLDVLKLLAAVLVVVAVCAAVFFAVRAMVRGIGRLVRRVGRRHAGESLMDKASKKGR